jgi:hypothetical protein
MFYISKVTNPYPFASTFGIEGYSMSMPSCSIFFFIFSCRRSVAYHGQENNELECFIISCICNNNLY